MISTRMQLFDQDENELHLQGILLDLSFLILYVWVYYVNNIDMWVGELL